MKKNDIVRSQMRIPPDLYEHLKEAAAISKRSLNAEIVDRLERSLLLDKELKQLEDGIKKNKIEIKNPRLDSMEQKINDLAAQMADLIAQISIEKNKK